MNISVCILLSLLMLASVLTSIKGLDPDLSDESRDYTKIEILSKLFDTVEFPTNLPILNRKIFQGKRVSIREHPYLASIRRNVAQYSVGCILTKNLIITVAHPLINVSVVELSIVVGENYSDRGSMLLTVILVIIHQDFDPTTLANDIALIRIYEDITFKGSAKSIPLIKLSQSLIGQKAFVTGWGRCDRTGTELCLPRSSQYTRGEKMDPMLRTVSFPFEVNSAYCDQYSQTPKGLLPGMLCTGVAREVDPIAPCLAVPGAPLVVAARLIGILSWGFGCGHTKDLPLIYTNLHHYQPWVRHNLQIFRNISKTYMSQLYIVKRAYILREWLRQTRVKPPEKDGLESQKLIALRILDSKLAELYGDVYDIRDYVFDRKHHLYKMKIYKELREGMVRKANADEKNEEIRSLFKRRNDTLRPFISKESLVDRFGSNVTDTKVKNDDYDDWK